MLSIKVFAPALAVLSLSACSITVPVIGLMGDGTEVYKGTATGYMGGTGDIKMKGVASGVECFGGFTYTRMAGGTGSKGIADVMCKNGRKATVEFLAESLNKGMGTGYASDGEPFVFTYGMSDEETTDVFRQLLSDAKPKSDKAKADKVPQPKASSI